MSERSGERHQRTGDRLVSAEGLAAALDGDGDVLRELARSDARVSPRSMPALWLRARKEGVESSAVDEWRRRFTQTAAQHLVLKAGLREAAEVLREVGVKWVPIKGIDLAYRLFDEPEERPTSDLDLMIADGDFDVARRALETAGWVGLASGPRYERYLREEAYAWQATHRSGVLLELHYRLWNQVPEGFAGFMFSRAQKTSDLFPGGAVLRWPDAYVVAAVHSWLNPKPRLLESWWDLARLADRASAELIRCVPDLARSWDLQLPVAMAARISRELWGRDACRQIAAALEPELKWAERRLARRARDELIQTSLIAMTSARFVAGRPSRGRWLTPWRFFWAHPGCVERATPEDWWWPRRRLWYLKRALAKPGPP